MKQAMAKMYRYERQSPVGFSQPWLLLRGYYSDTAWSYPERPSQRGGYVSDFRWHRMAATVNPADIQRLLRDKKEASEHLRRVGLGDHLPVDLGVIEDGQLTSDRRDFRGPVVLKPVAGRSGRGISVARSLQDAVDACAKQGRYLVQERLRSLPYSSTIFPHSVNAIRVVTGRDGSGSWVMKRVHRFGTRATAPVDGLNAGGLLSEIDSVGVLTPATGAVRGRRRDVLLTHPDTGERIDGVVVPHVRSLDQVALAAMDALPTARLVGWDVVMTERGAVILEGNGTHPGLGIMQAHGPLGVDERAVSLLRHVGALR